ncbi:hypothetical protein CKAH01_04125 [Colletotrichum kahawae]|uniref:Uncharacterized protein n=1 Tax=Colletotrichum kahawae TaxID=34407 RepID=A0AAD9YKP9_COLKA|nr:hypothetical protein CKAH01_04125 [Colletotrichum kahawae]
MKPYEDLRRRTTSTAGFHVVTEQRVLRCPGPVAQVEPSAATEAVASGFEECHTVTASSIAFLATFLRWVNASVSWFRRPTSSTCILVHDKGTATFLQVNRKKGGFNQMAALASGGHARPVPQHCVVRTGPDRNSHFKSRAGSPASAAQGSRMTTFAILLQTSPALCRLLLAPDLERQPFRATRDVTNRG